MLCHQPSDREVEVSVPRRASTQRRRSLGQVAQSVSVGKEIRHGHAFKNPGEGFGAGVVHHADEAVGNSAVGIAFDGDVLVMKLDAIGSLEQLDLKEEERVGAIEREAAGFPLKDRSSVGCIAENLGPHSARLPLTSSVRRSKSSKKAAIRLCGSSKFSVRNGRR